MVLGHTCKGLERYQSRINADGEAQPVHPCIPRFNEYGETVGCDDTNHEPIKFCPFCGVKL